MGFFASLPSVFLDLLVDGLSSDSFLGNESLDLGGFVEGLVSKFDFSSHDVLSDIVLLLSEGEGADDVVGSLGSKSSRSGAVGEAGNFSFSFDENFEGDNSEVGSADASSS